MHRLEIPAPLTVISGNQGEAADHQPDLIIFEERSRSRTETANNLRVDIGILE
jgi:hypothetical protein